MTLDVNLISSAAGPGKQQVSSWSSFWVRHEMLRGQQNAASSIRQTLILSWRLLLPLSGMALGAIAWWRGTGFGIAVAGLSLLSLTLQLAAVLLW